jgi:hypothetical protein
VKQTRGEAHHDDDTSPFTIHCLTMSAWVHNKGWSGRSYNIIRANFALRFNKAAQTEKNLHKLEEKSLTSSVLDVK